jgi:DNA polymerase elongation subunit (family B)
MTGGAVQQGDIMIKHLSKKSYPNEIDINCKTSLFIEKAYKKHGNKFDYSLTNYVGAKSPITIICSNNHTFTQSPNDHLNGHGCKICSGWGVIKSNPDEFIKIERLNKHNYTLETTDITVEKLISLIEKNKYTISASGALFRTDKRSAASSVLEYWFNKREYYRELKKKAGKAKEWDKFKLYDLFQLAFKILQNSHYGTYAKNMFRYTDGWTICSAAITNTGQVILKESIKYIDNHVNNILNMSKEELENVLNV